jgi:hypothetical protein
MYFVINDSDSTHKYPEDDIKEMLGFSLTPFLDFGNQIYQQTVGIPMGTNCSPLLADLFLHSYEADFIIALLHEKNKPFSVALNSTFRYIDDVLSINNDQSIHMLILSIPVNLKLSSTSASYLDVPLNIDAGGKITAQLYDKQDNLDFAIVNFPYRCSSIPLSPAYGAFISQLIRYARACSTYDQFLSRGRLLTDKLMLQGFL